MKTLKFISAIIAMLLLQSCNMVAQNVTPKTTNTWTHVYVKETRSQLHDLAVGDTKDLRLMAYVDYNGDFIADLKTGKYPTGNTKFFDYYKPYYILMVTPCDPAGNLIYGYSAIPVAFSPSALERMESETPYGEQHGVITVTVGSAWITNVIDGITTGNMNRDPRFGTYYVRN